MLESDGASTHSFLISILSGKKLDTSPPHFTALMEIGKSKRRPKWSYKIGQEEISKTKEEKDLGVMIQDTLNPEQLINKLFGSTLEC